MALLLLAWNGLVLYKKIKNILDKINIHKYNCLNKLVQQNIVKTKRKTNENGQGLTHKYTYTRMHIINLNLALRHAIKIIVYLQMKVYEKINSINLYIHAAPGAYAIYTPRFLYKYLIN